MGTKEFKIDMSKMIQVIEKGHAEMGDHVRFMRESGIFTEEEIDECEAAFLAAKEDPNLKILKEKFQPEGK